ncbi:MAG: hypothetical protein IJP67_07040 [Oscillospiraceae bacterium]|nr:hypothetical protein [Oscillospiraceae bacterium]MBR0063904.1 hypothetical protein [Oscillospiraceae bacterium]
MAKFSIKQGDAYSIAVRAELNGESLNMAEVESVEVMIGENIRKVYPGDISYDDENETLLVPVTQEETFSLTAGSTAPVDLRVKFIGGSVIGARRMIYVATNDALSEAIL